MFVNTAVKIIKDTSFAIIFSLLFFSTAYASELSGLANENDSLYRYNALENKASFMRLENNTVNVGNEFPIITLTDVADDIAQRLQDVTEKQDSSIGVIEQTMDKIKNRNGVRTFLVGNNLGILKFQMMQIKDQVYTLQTLAGKTQDDRQKIQIDAQIKLLQDEQKKVESFMLAHNNQFSLFGWFTTIL